MLEERPVLLNADGRTLLYHEVVDQAGADAPWLVFVHGAGGSIRTWKYQIEAFQPHYRLLLIDLRDHGFSKDILPDRAIYWLFSFIVLPRRNHRLSRWIFRRQSLRLTPGEYLKWVELYKPFFRLIKQYVERTVDKTGLVVMGAQDHIFFGAAEKFASAQKNMRLAVIENCGHVCSIEAPDLFNDLVLKFLSGKDVPARVTATPIPSTWAELKAMKG